MHLLVGECDCVCFSIGLECNGRDEEADSELEEHDNDRGGSSWDGLSTRLRWAASEACYDVRHCAAFIPCTAAAFPAGNVRNHPSAIRNGTGEE